jgi:hypothetical protein
MLYLMTRRKGPSIYTMIFFVIMINRSVIIPSDHRVRVAESLIKDLLLAVI